MTATILRHPRAGQPPGAYRAAFGSAAGPGFQWGTPAAPARPAARDRQDRRPATETVQPIRRMAR